MSKLKINERHLVAYANATPPDKEGYLQKKGELNKSFQKRWFVLKGNLLYYFERRTDKEPTGVIIVEGCTVELSEVADVYAFELVFQGSGSRTYVLAAESQDEMEAWMKAITCANYAFMRIMVNELQRKLDDLNSTPFALHSSNSANSSHTTNSSNAENNLLVDISSDHFQAPNILPQASKMALEISHTFEQFHEQCRQDILQKMAAYHARKNSTSGSVKMAASSQSSTGVLVDI